MPSAPASQDTPPPFFRRLATSVLEDLRQLRTAPEVLLDRAPDFDTYSRLRTLVVIRAAVLMGIAAMVLLIPTDLWVYPDGSSNRPLVLVSRVTLTALCIVIYAVTRLVPAARSTTIAAVGSTLIAGTVFYIMGLAPDPGAPFIFNVLFLSFVPVAFLIPTRPRILMMTASCLVALAAYYLPHPQHFRYEYNGVVAIYVAASILVSSVSGHLLFRLEQGNFLQRRQIRDQVGRLEELNGELQEKTHALENSLTRLKQLDRVKSTFLATVSHELRTPLTSIIGYSDLLMEEFSGPLNANQTQSVKTIRQQGGSLLRLISSMLDLSRLEAHGIDLNPSPADVPGLLHRALDTVKPLAQQKKLELSEQTDASLPRAMLDEVKIQQCVVNLLMNAVKFTPDGGKIHACAKCVDSADGRNIEISVEDNGIGIPAHEHKNIFDSFYQVDGSLTREFGGAGLGLSIVRSYVGAHEGTVRVDSIPGRGSTFTMRLPVVSPPPAQPDAPSQLPSA